MQKRLLISCPNIRIAFSPVRRVLSSSPEDISEQYRLDNKFVSSIHGKESIKRYLQLTPSSHLQASNMTDYLTKMSTAISSLPDFNPAIKDTFNHESTQRVLSSVLTFPLTLAYGINRLFPVDQPYPTNKLNILILGGRTESSLPRIWWKHLLYYLHHTNTMPNVEVNLKFIGPDVLLANKLSISTAAANTAIQTNSWQDNKHQLHYHTPCQADAVPFHDHPEAMTWLRWATVQVLLHPGYGNSKKHQKEWQPTIELLRYSRKPVLCTAYHHVDLVDDLRALGEMTAEQYEQIGHLGETIEMIVPTMLNPFASMRSIVYDDIVRGESAQRQQEVVMANQYLYAFQGK